MVTKFFQLPQKGVVICFGKTFVKRSSKTCGIPFFLVTQLEKLWRLNGDHIFKLPILVGDQNK